MKTDFATAVLILLSGNDLVGQYINIYGSFEERTDIPKRSLQKKGL